MLRLIFRLIGSWVALLLVFGLGYYFGLRA